MIPVAAVPGSVVEFTLHSYSSLVSSDFNIFIVIFCKFSCEDL